MTYNSMIVTLDRSGIRANTPLIGCAVYEITKIKPGLAEALEPLLATFTTPKASHAVPKDRASAFCTFANILLAYSEHSLIQEYTPVSAVSKPELSRFLHDQNVRRQNAIRFCHSHNHSHILLPQEVPNHLNLPPDLRALAARLLADPITHVDIPSIDPENQKRLTPVTIYSWEPSRLHKLFHYQALKDRGFFKKPADYKYAPHFKRAVDPEYNYRMRTWQGQFRMVFYHQWLEDHAREHGFASALKQPPDHTLHQPDVRHDLLMLQHDITLPYHAQRMSWEEIEQAAIGYYPDFRTRQRHYRTSPPRLGRDCFGTIWAMKSKIMVLPSTPSQLEGVRTNKDDDVYDLEGLLDPFDLRKIRGNLVYAFNAVIPPKNAVVTEMTGKAGRPKLRNKPSRTRPRKLKVVTKQEVNTKPTKAPRPVPKSLLTPTVSWDKAKTKTPKPFKPDEK